MDAHYVIRVQLSRDLNEGVPVYAEDQQLEVSIDGMDQKIESLFRHFEPFGIGNPQPLFFIRSVAPAGEPRLLKEKHRLFTLRHGASLFNAIHFNGARFPLPKPPWDIAFYLEANNYQNRVQLQLHVEALRSSGE